MEINKNHKDIMKQIDKIERENYFVENEEAKKLGVSSAKDFLENKK